MIALYQKLKREQNEIELSINDFYIQRYYFGLVLN
jgi:hypothetical protein